MNNSSKVKFNLIRVSVAILLVLFMGTGSVLAVSSTPNVETNQHVMNSQTKSTLTNIPTVINATATSKSSTKYSTGLYKVSGDWRYYENGSFKPVTGLVQRPDKKTWHFVVDGVYTKATGLVKCVQPGISKDKWYYVVKGDLSKETGLVKCIQPGISNGKWYYVADGKLRQKTGLVQCIQPGISNGKWYYVVDGKLKKDTGLVKKVQAEEGKNNWFYVVKGKLNKYTGIVKKPTGDTDKSYYVKKGAWNKTTGTVQDSSDKLYYRIKKGVFNNSNGIVQDRFYQNPDWMVQITQNISTHGQNFYVSPIRVNSSSTRDDHVNALIARAYEYLGDPYVWCEAGKPGPGVDCMGLVMQACYAAGIDLYPSTPYRMKYYEPYETRHVWKMDNLKTVSFKKALPGDLIFYTNSNGVIYHVAIYLGNERIIHAYPGEVQISSVYGWGNIAGAKRVFY